MTRVVGFLGARGAGKDTAALALVDRGWKKKAFGAGIYDECSTAFSVPRELFGRRETKDTPLPELMLANCLDLDFVRVALLRFDKTVPPGMDPMLAPRSPRFIMQTWGTEYRRKAFGESYWIDPIDAMIKADPGSNHACTDVREHLEIELVRRFGGPLIRIVNPDLEATDETTMQHSSETTVTAVPVDLELINRKGEQNIPVLQARVLEFVDRWFEAKRAA